MARYGSPIGGKRKKSKLDEALTIERSMADFQRAYRAKSSLVDREHKDFLFAMGEQWSAEDKAVLDKAGIKPFVDNRIAPNLFLLTGLERQNRTDFKAFPEGEEDGLKAEIATMLFKDAIKKSGFAHKSSEQFKDGMTCGESHLELYLDYTDSLLNGKPCWHKCDGASVFPDPASREYDFSDARFVYKVKLDVSEGDLINLYPEKRALIEESEGDHKLNLEGLAREGRTHRQGRDYPSAGEGRGAVDEDGRDEDESYDLVERYYKKYVERVFVGDKQTGEIRMADSKEKATNFVQSYLDGIENDQRAYQEALRQHQAQMVMGGGVPAPIGEGLPPMGGLVSAPAVTPPPPPPPEQNPGRFIVIKRMVPEIWCFAHVPGIEEPLVDERAWFYPKWKGYPFIPYFARFSTAPLTGEERHLLVQGIVHGVKGAQEKHNKAEMLMLRHLNTAANSGWLAEEDSWVDPKKVENFGTTPGVNLEYKAGRQKPERMFPTVLSQGHAQVSSDSAESIKAQLGINADLLATQQGGADSGRAIALRQKQGLLMVQELFDNLSRSRQIAGRFLLSQLGEIYDTDTAMKVLGEAFLRKNFPPLMLMNAESMQQEPMKDQYGAPMQFDKEMAELAIAEVLSGELDKYDVEVGESVASETQKMSVSMEVKEIAAAYPGLIPPDVLVRHSQLPESAKNEVLASIKQAQAAQAAAAAGPAAGGGLGAAPAEMGGS